MEKHLLTLCGLLLMAMGHILIWKVRSFNVVRTHHWLSFGAGASVAYVFIHVLPEIGIYQQKLLGYTGHNPHGGFISNHLYLAALGGVFLLYFLDYMENRLEDEELHLLMRNKFFIRVFLLKLVLYLLYNILVAYMVTQRPGSGIMNLLLISVGLMLHFVVLNLKVAEAYSELYDRYVRWVVSAGLFLGWVLGLLMNIPMVVEVTLFSIIGGTVTYVALKSELGHTKNRAPFYFFSGATIYTLLILAVNYLGHSEYVHPS